MIFCSQWSNGFITTDLLNQIRFCLVYESLSYSYHQADCFDFIDHCCFQSSLRPYSIVQGLHSCDSCLVWMLLYHRLFQHQCARCRPLLQVRNQLLEISVTASKKTRHLDSVLSLLYRIENCYETNLHIFSFTPPILIGDTRGLKIGPYNCTSRYNLSSFLIPILSNSIVSRTPKPCS